MGSAAARFRKSARALLVRRKAAGYGDIGPEEFGLLIAKKLEDRILELGPDHVASFSAEPVQGAGGVIFPPQSYWPEIQRSAKNTMCFCTSTKSSPASAAPANGSALRLTKLRPTS